MSAALGTTDKGRAPRFLPNPAGRSAVRLGGRGMVSGRPRAPDMARPRQARPRSMNRCSCPECVQLDQLEQWGEAWQGDLIDAINRERNGDRSGDRRQLEREEDL